MRHLPGRTDVIRIKLSVFRKTTITYVEKNEWVGGHMLRTAQ